VSVTPSDHIAVIAHIVESLRRLDGMGAAVDVARRQSGLARRPSVGCARL
jgi:hypothetical protein